MKQLISIDFGSVRVYDKKNLRRYISKSINDFQRNCLGVQGLENLRTKVKFDSREFNSKIRCQITMNTDDQVFKIQTTEVDFRANHAYNRTLKRLKNELTYDYFYQTEVFHVA